LRSENLARAVLIVASVVGGSAFFLIGWMALIFTRFGADAGEGFGNSQPVVLGLIFLPVLAPLVGWVLLALRRPWLAIGFSLATFPPAFIWIGMWLRAG
jgi:hypothetical protein